jgi:hypothetical protein
MGDRKRRYSKKEFARRGDAIYENDVRPQLKAADDGKFAAIDIETGEFALDADELKAGNNSSNGFPTRKSGWCESAIHTSIALAVRCGEKQHDYRRCEIRRGGLLHRLEEQVDVLGAFGPGSKNGHSYEFSHRHFQISADHAASSFVAFARKETTFREAKRFCLGRKLVLSPKQAHCPVCGFPLLLVLRHFPDRSIAAWSVRSRQRRRFGKRNSPRQDQTLPPSKP